VEIVAAGNSHRLTTRLSSEIRLLGHVSLVERPPSLMDATWLNHNDTGSGMSALRQIRKGCSVCPVCDSKNRLKKIRAAKEETTLVGTKVAGLAYALTTGCPPPVDIRGMAALAHPRAGAVSLLGTMLAAVDQPTCRRCPARHRENSNPDRQRKDDRRNSRAPSCRRKFCGASRRLNRFICHADAMTVDHLPALPPCEQQD